MAFITFIKDITSSAGVLFSQEELDKSRHLAPSTCSHSTNKHNNPTRTTAKTSQIVSLRQSYHSPPWGVNIPTYRQLATRSSSPPSSSSSSSSSSPESSVSSSLHVRRTHRPLVKSGLDIEFHQHQAIEPSQKALSKVDGPPDQPLHTDINLYNPDLGNCHKKHSDHKDASLGDRNTIHNNQRTSDLSTISHPQAIDIITKYPKSVAPAKSITTESAVLIRSLGTETLSRSYCSLYSLSSPQSQSDQPISPHSGERQNLLPAPKSPMHQSSLQTTTSPATCKTCRFPLLRTSSESSFLLNLSYRSPLFDDLDEDCASHLSDLSNPETASIEGQHRSGSQSSFSSTSPEASNSLSSWWSDIPPHRRAHIIEAESWPIFTPNAPSISNGSPPGAQCACPSATIHDSSTDVPDATCTELLTYPQESPHAGSPPSTRHLQSRPSFSTSLNLLVPIPLDQDETDPLLSTSPPASEITSVAMAALDTNVSHESTDSYESTDSQTSLTSSPSIRRRRRREESAPKSSESLLTKSLRRLSRKLPNIQWGNLSVRMRNNYIDSKGTITGEEEQEEENVLPSGVVDEDPSVGLVYDDDKAQISRLVKSWTLDNIQPQNSLNGSFINDPEMEWSSMVVQLETFSPNSSRKLRSGLQMQSEKKFPRSARAQQHSRKANSINELSRPNERRRSFGERSESSAQLDQTQVKRSQSKRNSKSSRNQQHQMNNSNQAHKRNSVRITKRVVSNPLHLLQLTLELEMMRKMKINCPLKQRSMKLILIKRGPGFCSNNSDDYVGSPLRFEVL